MADNKITGKEYTLSEIFSKEFNFYIPAYQRPYAWTEEETETLFDDLYDFFKDEKNDSYFLGSIVLIKEERNPDADVIDGQQRLTTLTILLAVIATHLQDKNKLDCLNYIQEPGNDLEEIEPTPRLHLRERDQEFFNKYIQNLELEELLKLDKKSLPNESQIHIKENCELLIKKFNENFHENKILDFCKFLLKRCYIVAVYTPSQQSAFRVFSVMNSRGLNLMPIDIIKSDIIGQIDKKDQKYYTDKWEDLEMLTTRSGFNDVFTHTRMIYAKSKPKQNLLDDFKKYVISKTNPKELIDDVLEPYSEAYIILKERKYSSTLNAEKINEMLYWLNKIDNSDWMPSAIKFLADKKHDSDYVLWFLKKLERLTSYLYITNKNVNQRIERYKLILDEMEVNPNHNINDKLSTIELYDDEKIEFKNALDGDIYRMTGKKRNYIILRLNSFVSDGGMGYESENSILTIEHVLPQTVNPNSQWEQWWPDEEIRKIWIDRIANLVPLTRKKNSEAQNYDFDKKKDIYFKGKNGTSSYPLTTQVLNEKTWTEEIVSNRQNNLMNIFEENWDLETNQLLDNIGNDNILVCLTNTDGRGDVIAIGYQTSHGFIVKAQSKIAEIVADTFEKYYPSAYKLRNELISKKIIVDYVFQEDYEFVKNSTAASVILGRTANGNDEWIDKSSKKYRDLIDKSSIEKRMYLNKIMDNNR